MTANFRKLKGTDCRIMVPSNTQTMMTGVGRAFQDRRGTVTLEYTDGERESRKCEHDIEGFPSWFALVGYVQDGRGAPSLTVEG